MPSTRSIAFVANTSWSIYKFRLYLIQKLIEHGYTLYVLAPRDPYTIQFENIPGLTYLELTKFRGKSISPLHDLQLYRELRELYNHIRPDLIFHYTIKANIFGSLAAARAQCPAVNVITGLGYAFSGNRLVQGAVKMIYRRVLRRNAETWFLNSDDRDVFIREKLVRPEKTFLLPGEGVDAEAFYPAPSPPEPTGPFLPASPAEPTPITFLLIARVIRTKGVFEYIRAAEILRQQGLPLRFQLLGIFDEGSPVAISRQQVDEWVSQKNIVYLGSTDDVAPFIAQSDCIVLPSYREGMPLSLLEGASMCKALIATDTPGCREVVRDGVNGYLCRDRDAADLARTMEKYYRLSPGEKHAMGLEGRKRVEQFFTREIVTGIYMDKIKELQT